MIEPSNFTPTMTLQEAVEGFVADGFDRADAERRARILLNPGAEGLPIV